MKLNQLGEFGLIDQLRRMISPSPGVKIGIGDDAAWVAHPKRSSLVTADLLIEGIHFDLRWTSLYDLGFKSLAVNLSDIAAMGGSPAYAVISIGVPARFDSDDVKEIYRGINAAARPHRVALVGGDTSIADRLLISVCLLGHPPRRPVTRSQANIGDDIYVSGTLGDSGLALALLKKKRRFKATAATRHLFARHHRPTPRVALGVALGRLGLANAMIDVSDGLVQDLNHICRSSSVSAVLWEEHLPLSNAYREIAGDLGMQPALTGGEDYELLFCARQSHRTRLQQVAKRTGIALSRIGECVVGHRGVSVIDAHGVVKSVTTAGHDHFKKR